MKYIFNLRFRKGQTPLACGGKLTRILKMLSLVTFFGFDFGHAAYRSYHLIDAGSSVIAHLGGTVTGVLLGFILLKDVNVERWEKLLKVVVSTEGALSIAPPRDFLPSLVGIPYPSTTAYSLRCDICL